MRPSLLALALVVMSTGCTTVRQLREPASVAVSGVAEKTRSKDALDYSIALEVAAAPEVVWAVLTDGASFTKWNSTLTKFTGTIAQDGNLELVSKVAPDRTFSLKVTTFEVPKHMVWEDGNSMFLGVRHFTLLPREGKTVLVMSETYSGGMLGMIDGSLPDFTQNFQTFAGDLKTEAERRVANP